MSGSSSTRRIRGFWGSAMCRRSSGPESDPGKLFPPGLPSPGIPETAEPPVDGQLSITEVFQHRVEKQDQHLSAAAEGQQMPLQPVGQAVPEAPGPNQHREHIDQNAVAQRGKQKCEQVVITQDRASKQLFQDEEKQDEQITSHLDQRSVIFEKPEGGESEPADPAEFGS